MFQVRQDVNLSVLELGIFEDSFDGYKDILIDPFGLGK